MKHLKLTMFRRLFRSRKAHLLYSTAAIASPHVDVVPVLRDNYSYLLHLNDRDVAVVDPGEASPILKRLEQSGKRLTHILNTHHHHE